MRDQENLIILIFIDIKNRILRQEIEQLESESVDIPNEHKKTANFCIRCKENFSFGFNYFYYSLLGQAEICPKCNHKVCTKCKVFENNNIEYKWVCKLCHKKGFQFFFSFLFKLK